MKIFKLILLNIIFISISLTACNDYSAVNIDDIIKPSSKVESDEDDSFTLTVWAGGFDNDSIKKAFYSLYPKANVEVVTINNLDSKTIIEDLANGNEADIYIYSKEIIGEFNAINGMENLLQNKYQVDEIEEYFSQRELKESMSMDKKKLIALPFEEVIDIAYYRTDIFENVGITTDPFELANLMETPEGLLSIAERLKENNSYLTQWKDEFVRLALSSGGYFDEEMNLIVDNEKVREALYMAQKVDELGLASKYDIWSKEGEAALKSGKIAMFYTNKWGVEHIKKVIPETEGLWRVTRLPLGLYNSYNTNCISISAYSGNKEEAWQLVKKLTIDERSYYKSIINEENSFLGSQKENLLCKELAEKQSIKYPTMLDDTVSSMFIKGTNTILENKIEVEDFMGAILKEINNTISGEQNILRRYIDED